MIIMSTLLGFAGPVLKTTDPRRWPHSVGWDCGPVQRCGGGGGACLVTHSLVPDLPSRYQEHKHNWRSSHPEHRCTAARRRVCLHFNGMFCPFLSRRSSSSHKGVLSPRMHHVSVSLREAVTVRTVTRDAHPHKASTCGSLHQDQNNLRVSAGSPVC